MLKHSLFIITLKITINIINCDEYCYKLVSGDPDSYFGYKVQLRSPGRLLVTAPRGNSSWEQIPSPGVVYSCSIEDGQCHQYLLHGGGNYKTAEDAVTHMKNDSWIGADMDGPEHEEDPLVVS